MLSLCVRRFACSPYQHSVAESLSTDKRSISAGSAIVPTIPEVDKRRELSDETSTFGTCPRVVVVKPTIPIMVDPPPKVTQPQRKQKSKKQKRMVSSASTVYLNKLVASSDIYRTAEDRTFFSQCRTSGVLFSHSHLTQDITPTVESKQSKCNPVCEAAQNENIGSLEKNTKVTNKSFPSKPLQNITNEVAAFNGAKKKNAYVDKKKFSVRNC
ncbi:uncharacterized protein LOC111083720 isoform X1 [Limulus polyphemus]|uniref:Uncharacterized protein LOC111083720 isoform X1 n=1 Tax=Limulus polyphemus TaxID=6850 RepID=A0ABM1RXI7_LIMPO|nr:uncharacterized protein LOC111083720 isoform X1 [Limulus polyphemus]